MSDYSDGTNYYHGAVLNKPTIRDSLDLARSRSRSSNITLDVANFDYKGEPLSEFLFGGSNYFINKEVIVKSMVNRGTPEAIGYFRVDDISHTEEKIKLSLVLTRGWMD